MSAARYSNAALNEPTMAIIGGDGEGAGRIVSTRTGANYDADRNFGEMWVDARGSSTTAQVDDAGDIELAVRQSIPQIDFDLLETPSTTQYPVDFPLNTIVTIEYAGIAETRKISSVTVSVTGNAEETIAVETINWTV
jgi:hypothetical protein